MDRMSALIIGSTAAVLLAACDAPALSCLERMQRADAVVATVIAANGLCAQDQDCTLANPSTDCGGRCYAAVAAASVAAVQAAVADSNAAYCATYGTDGCEMTSALCVEPVAKCVLGQCATHAATR